MEATIRPAGPADADAMAALARAAYQPWADRIGVEPAPMTADYRDIVSRGEGWVAERDGRVVGLVVLVPHADHLLLENVAVEAGHRRGGLGARLLDLADEQARACGLPEVRLYTNAAMAGNLAWYPRHGYVETHRGAHGGFERVFFGKHVGPRPAGRP